MSIAFGWVQNITSDLLSGVPQSDITAVEGETITLTLFFVKNNPSNFIIFDFALSTSGSATGIYMRVSIYMCVCDLLSNQIYLYCTQQQERTM